MVKHMRWARRDQLAKLSVHVEIASELNRQIDERRLTDLGKLEQARLGVLRSLNLRQTHCGCVLCGYTCIGCPTGAPALPHRL